MFSYFLPSEEISLYASSNKTFIELISIIDYMNDSHFVKQWCAYNPTTLGLAYQRQTKLRQVCTFRMFSPWPISCRHVHSVAYLKDLERYRSFDKEVIFISFSSNEEHIEMNLNIYLLVITILIQRCTCDYLCLCNYNVEQPVYMYKNAVNSETPVGSLYEYDCNTLISEGDPLWATIAYHDKVSSHAFVSLRIIYISLSFYWLFFKDDEYLKHTSSLKGLFW